MHASPQRTEPTGQSQLPEEQSSSPGQARLHCPQCWLLEPSETHCPVQQAWPLEQGLLHRPQCLALVARSAHSAPHWTHVEGDPMMSMTRLSHPTPVQQPTKSVSNAKAAERERNRARVTMSFLRSGRSGAPAAWCALQRARRRVAPAVAR
jgi:hypothetical protein